MKILGAFLSMFRRPAKAAEAYGAEVLFAGWVDLPPNFGPQKDQRPPARDSSRAIST